MSCYHCAHWGGDIYDKEKKTFTGVGYCHLQPVPIKTSERHFCGQYQLPPKGHYHNPNTTLDRLQDADERSGRLYQKRKALERQVANLKAKLAKALAANKTTPISEGVSTQEVADLLSHVHRDNGEHTEERGLRASLNDAINALRSDRARDKALVEQLLRGSLDLQVAELPVDLRLNSCTAHARILGGRKELLIENGADAVPACIAGDAELRDLARLIALLLNLK